VPTSGRQSSAFFSDAAILGDLEMGGAGSRFTGDDGRVEAGVLNCEGTSQMVELYGISLVLLKTHTRSDNTFCLASLASVAGWRVRS
jgi:hypothetical protein